jgi:excisionase family DNA binding protein
LRNVQDWNKYVDMLGKAVVKKQPAPVAPLNGVNPPPGVGPAREMHSGPVVDVPLHKARGSRKEETREELLRRLVDPTLTLEETACILEVCPTTVRRYTNRGILPHERSPGNQRRFKLSSVLAFKEDKQQRKETGDLSQSDPFQEEQAQEEQAQEE